jgi:hypothetical protein
MIFSFHRCIRHAADYGVIILLDSRHCDDGMSHLYNNDGICQAHAKLPKWMRSNVKTLRVDNRSLGSKDILSGWKGLKMEMKNFFKVAKAHSSLVLKQQMESLKKSQAKTSSDSLSFDKGTGNWSQSQNTPTKFETKGDKDAPNKKSDNQNKNTDQLEGGEDYQLTTDSFKFPVFDQNDDTLR